MNELLEKYKELIKREKVKQERIHKWLSLMSDSMIVNNCLATAGGSNNRS